MKWISIDDKRPADKQKVFMKGHGDGNPMDKRYGVVTFKVVKKDGKPTNDFTWDWHVYEGNGVTLTHWLPIPDRNDDSLGRAVDVLEKRIAEGDAVPGVEKALCIALSAIAKKL